jgi:hypothetical protein
MNSLFLRISIVVILIDYTGDLLTGVCERDSLQLEYIFRVELKQRMCGRRLLDSGISRKGRLNSVPWLHE